MKRQILLSQQQRTIQCHNNDTLLRAALRAGERWPYECNSGGCGSCGFQLLSGEVEVLWPEAPGWTERAKKTNRYLGCQCRPLSDCEIKVATMPGEPPIYPPQRQQVQLSEVLPLTEDMSEFRFQSEGLAEFLPGQYAMFELPNVKGARAYSMSNVPNEQGEWHFIIKRKPGGAGSDYLFEQAQAGDRLAMDGPYGLAYLQVESERPLLLLAGGSGLSPILSIARAVAHDPGLIQRSMHLYYGARSPQDLCIEPYLKAEPLLRERLQVTPVISDLESAEQAGWQGKVGYVHDIALQALGDRLARHEIYFCGPPPMIDALSRALLVDHQVPFDQVHYDRFF